jgi:soluble lytic murein transglycosylase-like protein
MRGSKAVMVVGAMGLTGLIVGGAVMARHVLAVAAEEDSERLNQAILDYIVERNPAAPVDALRRYPEVLVAEARKSNIDHCLALAQAEVESEFRPDAVGSAGEIGLYQILPRTAAFIERIVGQFRRPSNVNGRRDLGDLADPVVSTHFAMAYLRDILTRKPSIREALTEYNGGPSGRHYRYYEHVMGTYVEVLEHPDLRCRFQTVPSPSPVIALISRI